MNNIDLATWNALQTSVFPGANDDSIMMAVSYCQARGLDVLKKPVHIVPMNVKDSKTGSYGWRDIIMPGISEIRTTASRSGSYAGQDAPIFSEIEELNIGGIKVKTPDSCTVTVYRMIHGERVPFSHTEYFIEACATKKDGALNSMWTKRPRGQLSKCAEAGALRKAFPEEIGGEITADEVATDGKSSNLNHVDVIESMSKETAVSLQKAFSATNTDIPELLKQNNIELLSDLSEEQAQTILQAKRAEFTAQKQAVETQETETPIEL
jgi:phage recombination protein Bet